MNPPNPQNGHSGHKKSLPHHQVHLQGLVRRTRIDADGKLDKVDPYNTHSGQSNDRNSDKKTHSFPNVEQFADKFDILEAPHTICIGEMTCKRLSNQQRACKHDTSNADLFHHGLSCGLDRPNKQGLARFS